jgi:hypothetical protein
MMTVLALTEMIEAIADLLAEIAAMVAALVLVIDAKVARKEMTA